MRGDVNDIREKAPARTTGGRIKVPLGEVVAESYRAVFRRPGRLLDLGWLPILIMLALALLPGLLLAGGAATADDGLTLRDALDIVVALLCLSAFAVRWHHAVLFAEGRAASAAQFRRAWARFLVYSVVLYLVSAGMAALVMATLAAAGGAAGAAAQPPSLTLALAALAAAAAALAVWFAIARCSLIFPAAAYERPLGWGEAWRLMRGNTWRFLGANLLAVLPVMMAAGALLSLVLAAARIDLGVLPERLPTSLFVLLGLADTLLRFVLVALGASVLAGFYRRIVLPGQP
jgi:hypothetical protein